MAEYKVTGPQKVFGHEPGETFKKDLSEDEERRKVASGALRKVSSSKPKGPTEKKEV